LKPDALTKLWVQLHIQQLYKPPTMCAMVTPPSDAPSSAVVGSSNSVDDVDELEVVDDDETRVTEHAETRSRMATPACASAAEAAATVAGSSAPPASNTGG
jgi:hypothetical protein